MSERECSEYYYKTGKIPPCNLINWVSVYNILMNAGFGELNKK